MMFYNHPVCMGLDYFVNNSDVIETSISDKNSGGFLKRKPTAKVGAEEKAIFKGGIATRRVMSGCARF